MTYNFDPDRWLALNRMAIQARAAAGEISTEQLKHALDELERRYEDMITRLDGSFRLPDSH